jgi:hypothetical protein
MAKLLELALVLLSLVGCTSAYRTELVAQARMAAVEPEPAAPLEAELVIPPRAADAYVLEYAIRLPRAMEVAYEVRCPAGTQTGVLGETFDSYRTRRQAELEEARRREAQLVGSLVGAVVPSAQASASAAGPYGSEASVQATVDPGELATAAALQSLPPAELPPGDVGARTLREELVLDGTSFGSCVFALSSNVAGQDISGATVELALRRRIDVAAEQAARAAIEAERQAQAARELRAALELDLERVGATRRTAEDRRRLGFELRAGLTADLIASGADPELRARERAAAEAERARVARERAEAVRVALEARWALEAEQQARSIAEQRERARLDAELRAAAYEVRADLRVSLIALGADPELRRREAERLRLEREATAARLRLEREATAERLRIEWEAGLDLRADLSSDLIALGADPELRRRQAEAAARERVRAERAQARAAAREQREAEARARDVRLALAEVRADLSAVGAVGRPPMPAPRYEVRPAAPFQGAIWTPGEWVWAGDAWVWLGGRYEARTSATARGLGAPGLGMEGGVAIEVPPVRVRVRTGRR